MSEPTYTLTLKVSVSYVDLKKLIPSGTVDVELFNPSSEEGYIDNLKGEIIDVKVNLGGKE